MKKVTLLYPNGQRQEVLLGSVPRIGESIRLKSDRPATPA
jgi:hypothetical protein